MIITGLLLGVLLTACGAKENTEEVSLFDKKMIVGTDIAFDDINDFYYTKENINYDAYYQRYRFYAEDGKHLFFHETRERPEDYGPCTEEDTVRTGTIELSDAQWKQFCDLVSGGTVKARSESADSGDSGPWLYLYWTNDKSKYQQFSFDSYETEAKFEEFCHTLASNSMYKLSFNDSDFDLECVPEDENDASNEETEDMRLSINGEEVPVTWEDNESVEELKTLCPRTIQMSMYGGFEQVGSLGSRITRNDEQITTDFGDIVLYSGNQIVIFYGSNSWAYTRLGHVDMTKEELAELLGNGDVEITIE